MKYAAVILAAALLSCGPKPPDPAPKNLPAADIRGVIDVPRNGADETADFILGRWAFASGMPLQDVLITLDHRPLIAVPLGIARPDVARAFPTAPQAVNSGWHMLIPIRDLSTGEHEFEAAARLPDGRKKSLGVVVVNARK